MGIALAMQVSRKKCHSLQCHSDRREGTKEGNEEEEIFHYVQNDKSVGGVIAFGPYGGVILCSVILTVGKDLKTAAKYL